MVSFDVHSGTAWLGDCLIGKLAALLFHLEPLVSECEFLHRHVCTFSFHRSANEFDYACADQLPGLYHHAMIFTLKLDRDVPGGRLVAVSDIVEPVKEVH